jgi:hypothetical protein
VERIFRPTMADFSNHHRALTPQLDLAGMRRPWVRLELRLDGELKASKSVRKDHNAGGLSHLKGFFD